MRLLRLVDDDSFAVEFHPFITVVNGLDEARRDAIVAAFEQAAVGRTTGLQGLMEVHGVVLDLDDRSLALLELGADDVDTSIRPSDLPGSVSGGVGRQVRSAERRLESLEQPQRDLVDALSAAEDELERAETAERAATERLRTLDDVPEPTAAPPPDTDDAADEGDGRGVAARDELTRRRADLEAERSALQEARDPDAGRRLDDAIAALDAAQTALDRAQEEALATTASTAVEEAPVDIGGQPVAPPEPALSDDEREDLLADLRAALALHRLEDPTPIRDALDEVRLGHHTGEMVPSTEALSLADRIESLEREIGTPEPEGDAPTSADLDAAAADVERARTTLAELERRSTESGTGADVEALETAHAEVERAREGVGGRLGRARAQRRLDAAVAAENELLDRLGLTSYTEFLTLGGAAARPDSSAAELESARRSVEAAEAAAEELEGRVDRALASAELAASHRALLDEARALLGDDALADDQVTAALIEHRVPASAAVQIDVLVDLLDAVGLPVRGLGLGDDEIEEMASEWLADRQHTEARILRRIDELESPVASPHPDDDHPDAVDLGDVDHEDSSGDDEDADAGSDGDAPALDAEAVLERFRDDVAAAEAEVRSAKDAVIAHEQVLAQLTSLDDEWSRLDDEIGRLDAQDAAEAARADAAAQAEAEAARASNDERAERTAAVEAAAAATGSARAAVETAREQLERANVDYSAAVEELAALRRTLADLDDVPPPVEEVEWYLLARLAAQRQQSFVGSLPLVLVGALDAVEDGDGLEHLLDRLERMAGAVQIIHLTDDPRITAWAQALPAERAAVVRPVDRVG